MELITLFIILGVAVGGAVLATSCDNSRRIKNIEDKILEKKPVDRKWS